MQVRFGANYGINYDPAIPKPLQAKLNERLMASILYDPGYRYVMDTTFSQIDINVRPFPSSGPKRTEPFGEGDMLDISARLHGKIARKQVMPEVNLAPIGEGSDGHQLDMTSSVDLVREGGGGGDYLSIGALTEQSPAGLKLLGRAVSNLMGNVLMLDAAYRGAQQAIQTPVKPGTGRVMPSIHA